MLRTNKKIAIATLAAIGVSTFSSATIQPAQADSKTWKKVAIGAGVVAAYGLLDGKKDLATIGGVAAVGSYLKYKSDKKQEDQRARDYDYRYNSRYGNNGRYNNGRRYGR